MKKKEGIVFILTNDAMPGFTRMDYTKNDDLAQEIRKINNSDIPLPFKLYFAAQVNDCELVDRNIHYIFSNFCETRDSHFFRANPDQLRAALELSATARVELSDEEVGISPELRMHMDQIKASYDALRLGAFSAPPGTVLFFAKDTNITCTALGDGMVEFKGDKLTPGEATLRAIREIGFDWEEVSAADYWLPRVAGPATNGDAAESLGGMSPMHDRGTSLRSEVDNSPVMFIRNSKA